MPYQQLYDLAYSPPGYPTCSAPAFAPVSSFYELTRASPYAQDLPRRDEAEAIVLQDRQATRGHFWPHGKGISGWAYVPQRSYIPQSPYNPVTILEYKVNGKVGILLSDACNRRFEGLEQRDDLAFTSIPGQKASLRILWPGYQQDFSCQFNVKDARKNVQSISVAKSAHEIACKTKKALDMYTLYTCNDAAWKIGPGHIGLNQLLLVRVVQVSKAGIQPVFCVSRL
ncbi:hypothetical protein WOLCODRAFT_15997 [Wolfiporia cocos MD-104 SS10]|uniref:Uncharacterized protein n=1 Tax=Wolfiporia cocos (strain MD-104) TaxID=742152 RepID=A0A2H3JRN1_WOLCO|nr:hypothetical protein WOLCODRAFT_15997 [Wolfiporia cocos MD-104 SS10]